MIHKVRKMCECGCERDAFDPRGSNRVQERVSNAWNTGSYAHFMRSKPRRLNGYRFKCHSYIFLILWIIDLCYPSPSVIKTSAGHYQIPSKKMFIYTVYRLYRNRIRREIG